MRALLFASLCDGKSTIRDVLPSPDTDAMLNACKQLGAKIAEHQHHGFGIEGVSGYPRTPDDVINAGNSGLVYRFVAAVAGLCKGYTVLTGDASIRHRRPIAQLLKGLRDLGAFAESARGDGHAPVIVRGLMQPGSASLSAEDSQLLSALLIAASFMDGTTEITVENLGELPWIQMTLDWLERLGAEVSHDNYARFRVKGRSSHPAFNYTVPGDFSSAAFPLVAGVLTQSEVTLTHLDMEDNQGDKAIVELLQGMGARITVETSAQRLITGGACHLKGKEIDVNPTIDALPILAVVGCFAEGETVLVNAEIARKKESDRIAAIAKELGKMGADIEERKDGLVVRQSELHGATVHSHKDHRIAMALAVAGLAAKGSTRIEDVDCVHKSYGDFFNHLRFLGAKIDYEY